MCIPAGRRKDPQHTVLVAAQRPAEDRPPCLADFAFGIGDALSSAGEVLPLAFLSPEDTRLVIVVSNRHRGAWA